MARKGHTEEEILRVPREAESGETVVEVCRRARQSASRVFTFGRRSTVVWV